MSTRKKLFAVVTLALFMSVLASQSLSAQEQESSATLEETLKFISGKVDHTVDALGEEYTFKFESISGCKVKIISTHEDVAKVNDTKVTDTYLFSLGDLEPLSIKLWEAPNNVTEFYSLQMQTSSSNKSITWNTVISHSRKPDESFTSKNNFVEIYFSNHEETNRVIRALKHAVKLCGGKVDPF